MSLAVYGIPSVSIPSGVNDLSWIEHDWEFLKRFETIYLCMDNDKAGQSIVETLAKRLGRWRCRNVILPYKDANECLMKKVDRDRIYRTIIDSPSFDLSELKNCSSYIDEIIDWKNNPEKLNGSKTSNEKLNSIIKGWRNEEVTIWSGANGSGKSTYLSQEVLHLIDTGKKVCIGSFEMPPRKYLWWLVKQYLKDNIISDTAVKSTLEALASKLFIIDILGNIEKENLFEVMEFAYMKYGVDVFVIDSLMKVNLTSDSTKILGEQKKFVSELKDFTSDYKSHIHLVAHPRKGTSDSDYIDKTDVAGSADITNLADNVIVMHRFSEKQKEDLEKKGKEKFDAMLSIKKNREHGELGAVGLYFRAPTKSFFTEKASSDYS